MSSLLTLASVTASMASMEKNIMKAADARNLVDCMETVYKEMRTFFKYRKDPQFHKVLDGKGLVWELLPPYKTAISGLQLQGLEDKLQKIVATYRVPATTSPMSGVESANERAQTSSVDRSSSLGVRASTNVLPNPNSKMPKGGERGGKAEQAANRMDAAPKKSQAANTVNVLPKKSKGTERTAEATDTAPKVSRAEDLGVTDILTNEKKKHGNKRKHVTEKDEEKLANKKVKKVVEEKDTMRDEEEMEEKMAKKKKPKKVFEEKDIRWEDLLEEELRREEKAKKALEVKKHRGGDEGDDESHQSTEEVAAAAAACPTDSESEHSSVVIVDVPIPKRPRRYHIKYDPQERFSKLLKLPTPKTCVRCEGKGYPCVVDFPDPPKFTVTESGLRLACKKCQSIKRKCVWVGIPKLPQDSNITVLDPKKPNNKSKGMAEDVPVAEPKGKVIEVEDHHEEDDTYREFYNFQKMHQASGKQTAIKKELAVLKATISSQGELIAGLRARVEALEKRTSDSRAGRIQATEHRMPEESTSAARIPVSEPMRGNTKRSGAALEQKMKQAVDDPWIIFSDASNGEDEDVPAPAGAGEEDDPWSIFSDASNGKDDDAVYSSSKRRGSRFIHEYFAKRIPVYEDVDEE